MKNGMDVLLKIKNNQIDSNDYNNFIKRTSVYLYSLLKKEKIDMIIIPKGTSGFLKDFAIFFKQKFGNTFDVYDDINKGDVNNVNINTDNEWVKNSATKYLDRLKRNEKPFSLKSVYKKIALSFSNFLTITDHLQKKVKDKNIIILDDVLSTGTTLVEIDRLLKDAKQLSFFTIFKSK